MKTATLLVRCVEVCCPYCDAAVEEPGSGSLMWEFLDPRFDAGAFILCQECSQQFELPTRDKITRFEILP